MELHWQLDYLCTHTHTHTHTSYPFTVVAPPPQSAFHSSSTVPPPDASHSDSTAKDPSPPPTTLVAAPHNTHHPVEPQGPDSQDRGAHSHSHSAGSGGHVGDEVVSEAKLDEVASRLVADVLSRAVYKCYAERMGDTGRQVCIVIMACDSRVYVQ